MRNAGWVFALFALSAGAPFARAADQDFNGRWDITVHKPMAEIRFTTTKAWWLEVSGAGTPEIKVIFVGPPDGGVDDIPGAKIENGVLHYTWVSRSPRDTQRMQLHYQVKYVNGKLEGSMSGLPDSFTFTGVRAPEIKDHDDDSWVRGKPIVLFNGKDLSGWTGVDSPKSEGWMAENGVLKGTGRADDLVTVAKYWNFELHAEYKLGARSNSGIGLRGRYEVQIASDYGAAPGIHGTGSVCNRVLPRINAGKQPDEWQTYDIRLVGREVTTTFNGEKLYEKGVIDGLTGIAFDANEGEPGPIELQGDHGAVEFRNLILTPLTKRK